MNRQGYSILEAVVAMTIFEASPKPSHRTSSGAMAKTGKPSAISASGPCRKSALLYGSTAV